MMPFNPTGSTSLGSCHRNDDLHHFDGMRPVSFWPARCHSQLPSWLQKLSATLVVACMISTFNFDRSFGICLLSKHLGHNRLAGLPGVLRPKVAGRGLREQCGYL